jgi:hypothetical protein
LHPPGPTTPAGSNENGSDLAPRRRSASVRAVSREVSSAWNSCHNGPSALASSSKLCGTSGRRSSYSGGMPRDIDAPTLGTGGCNITQPSDHTTSTSGADSGAGPTTSPDWPPLEAESPPAGVPATPRLLASRLAVRSSPHP